ncbi:MAG: hypothetical protein ACXWKR_17390 [Phenylobacterium sp.]
MGRFTMYFEWSEAGPAGDLKPYDLDAETLDRAKMQAAMIYAGASFTRTPPQAYRIEGARGEIVYRFPERQAAERRGEGR